MTVQLETQMLTDGVHYLFSRGKGNHPLDIGKAVYQIDGAGRQYVFQASEEAKGWVTPGWDFMAVRTLKAADYLALAYAEELHHHGLW